MDKYRAEWNEMLKSIGAKSMLWGIQGGNEWISYKQNDENDFSVQIFTHDDFETYKSQKDAVKSFFESRGSIFTSETDVKFVAFGYWKQLEFVDKDKYEIEQKQMQELIQSQTQPYIGTQINGYNQSGGSFITGTAHTIDNSCENTPEDQKWFQKEIIKQILSFIGGVGATLLAQWIMRFLGWIS